MFKMLSDGTRLKLFWLLCHCEECVVDLAAMMNMSSPALSHHLRMLRQAGLIVGTRKGKEMYYTAAKSRQAQTLHVMIESMADTVCPKG